MKSKNENISFPREKRVKGLILGPRQVNVPTGCLVYLQPNENHILYKLFKKPDNCLFTLLKNSPNNQRFPKIFEMPPTR